MRKLVQSAVKRLAHAARIPDATERDGRLRGGDGRLQRRLADEFSPAVARAMLVAAEADLAAALSALANLG